MRRQKPLRAAPPPVWKRETGNTQRPTAWRSILRPERTSILRIQCRKESPCRWSRRLRGCRSFRGLRGSRRRRGFQSPCRLRRLWAIAIFPCFLWCLAGLYALQHRAALADAYCPSLESRCIATIPKGRRQDHQDSQRPDYLPLRQLHFFSSPSSCGIYRQ